ncbi:uncharacterized protein F5Z01DRAFT_550060 [Emericellopsis atlantica]|uniref:FAD-containing monooxygenase EthA n=1 Tax=Emericellopsis atlantica TaxID=2614577 RepID=A0A9P7ZPT8_9HYPO|nr:uncharacterized protein F5Z01DRAFT_550060 [Emericellopsis atlantica]KAG9255621.1 hypothetical protein F5Z01DRAFT_550060 [Emericellopsis atlantica]
MATEKLDVIIVGAGISGINTAYYLQARGPVNTTYAILEGRGRLGGTWDLFQYPGIRSDSDVFTFGFSWNPWKGTKPIRQGPNIWAYLNESAAKEGIDKKIRYHQKVVAADWNSQAERWTLRVRKIHEGAKEHEHEEEEEVLYETKFLVLGTGYYNYEQPLETIIPGIQDFKGPVIRPQHWPQDLDYVNKNVVVIGSGATAITLVPSMAEDARKVTMLQRSPSYLISMASSQSILMRCLWALLPTAVMSRIQRLRFMAFSNVTYFFCQWFPRAAKRFIKARTMAQLPANYPFEPHFKPRYNPWDQRMCLCPDGDFFAALRSTKADIVTDTIEQVTDNAIRLHSGKTLRPDIIVAATGLKLLFAGGMALTIDGQPLDAPSKFTFKGAMLQDAPNLAFVMGYANASWTLGAEATAIFLTRLWHGMRKKGIRVVTPRGTHLERTTMETQPLLPLSSSYVHKGAKDMPKGGTGVWAPRRNFVKDLFLARTTDPLQGLEVR